MPTITSFLAFKDKAEEAATFYCSVFPSAKILSTTPYPDIPVAPKPGLAMVVEVELFGQRYIFMNGGDHFRFTDAFSLAVECDSQAEIDRYWDALVAGGGEHGPCGWLKDRFGLSWQVMPKNIAELIGSGARAKRVMEVVLKSDKLDIAAMERAAQG
jgi:predicted 3-demethylubiquinone-9 3-methyltransferase (glyoxalase superfamily)